MPDESGNLKLYLVVPDVPPKGCNSNVAFLFATVEDAARKAFTELKGKASVLNVTGAKVLWSGLVFKTADVDSIVNRLKELL